MIDTVSSPSRLDALIGANGADGAIHRAPMLRRDADICRSRDVVNADATHNRHQQQIYLSPRTSFSAARFARPLYPDLASLNLCDAVAIGVEAGRTGGSATDSSRTSFVSTTSTDSFSTISSSSSLDRLDRDEGLRSPNDETATPAAPQKQQRTSVSFPADPQRLVVVHEIPNLDSYTPSHKEEVWYVDADYQRIHVDIQQNRTYFRNIQTMHHRGYVSSAEHLYRMVNDNPEFCRRGLEVVFGGLKRRMQLRKELLRSIWAYQQESNYYRCNEDDVAAEYYANAMEALRQGQKDQPELYRSCC